MRKHFIDSYFDTSKKGRTGTVALLAIVAICIVIPFITPLFISTKKYDHSEFEKQIASLKIKRADSTARYREKTGDDNNNDQPYNEPAERQYAGASQQEWNGELFYFDPNRLDETGWWKLGLKAKTIATIKNYVSKGGKFYKPEDIKKIWGLDKDLADKLIPYIQIEKKEWTGNGQYTTDKPVLEKKTYTPPVVNINTADTTAFIALPGIGSKLAQRIITFRDKLGGFYKIEQVAETFGLADSVFQKIKTRLVLNSTTVKQININTATVDELKTHPYLRYAIANAIVQYRNQHGNYTSVGDLQKIAVITGDIFSKSVPYLKVN